MGSKKVAKKKKRIEPKIAKKGDYVDAIADVALEGLAKLRAEKEEAIECLKHYIHKHQIGDLANPAIELLTKWGIIVEPKP